MTPRAVLRGLWRDKRARLGLMILLLELAAVVFLPLLLPWGPNSVDAVSGFWAMPSGAHLLGTDDVGRDLLARLLAGGRTSMAVGVSSAAISICIGAPLGVLAGYRRGRWEFGIMRLADVFQCFPSLVVTLCLVTLWGPSTLHVILIIGIMGWPVIARMTYSETVSIRKRPYLAAARLSGATAGQLLLEEVLPDAMAPVWAALAFRVGRGILSESTLSFLGVGIRTPQASWGNLIHYAAQLSVLVGRPWVWLPPGVCILVTVLSVNLVGEGLQRVFRSGGEDGP